MPPRSGGLRKTRFAFLGTIWMRLKNSGIALALAKGRTRHTSRQDRRSMCAMHLSPLSRPFGAGPASSLFVVGCRRRPSCDAYQVPGYSHLLLDQLDVCSFFSAGSSKQNTRGLFAAACRCCFFTISLFFTFLSPPKCMRQGLMVFVSD